MSQARDNFAEVCRGVDLLELATSDSNGCTSALCAGDCQCAWPRRSAGRSPQPHSCGLRAAAADEGQRPWSWEQGMAAGRSHGQPAEAERQERASARRAALGHPAAATNVLGRLEGRLPVEDGRRHSLPLLCLPGAGRRFRWRAAGRDAGPAGDCRDDL
eukprot:7244112-Prymnesium_polylepis.1